MNKEIEETEEIDENAHLTPEQRAQVERALSGNWEQGANGYDLSLFRENLRRTPTERIERLQAALQFFLEVKKASANRIPKIHRVDGP